MEIKTIHEPEKFFQELGGMHDAQVEKVSLSLNKNEIAVSIDDLNAAFFELPGYKGHQPATIVLEGTDDVIFEISPITKMVRVYDLEIREEGAGKDKTIEITFKLSPGGLLKAKCKVIKLELN